MLANVIDGSNGAVDRARYLLRAPSAVNSYDKVGYDFGKGILGNIAHFCWQRYVYTTYTSKVIKMHQNFNFICDIYILHYYEIVLNALLNQNGHFTVCINNIILWIVLISLMES